MQIIIVLWTLAGSLWYLFLKDFGGLMIPKDWSSHKGISGWLNRLHVWGFEETKSEDGEWNVGATQGSAL